MAEAKDVGLFLMSSSSAIGLWALFNPGFFDIIRKGIAAQPPEPDELAAIHMGMNLGMAAIGLNSISTWLLHGPSGIVPAIAGAITGAGLYLAYNFMLHEAVVPGVPSWAPSPTPPLEQEPIGDVMKGVKGTVDRLNMGT